MASIPRGMGISTKNNSIALGDCQKRTIPYGLWHCSRIEDITMNMLVGEKPQVFTEENWKERINTKIIDTGNAMSQQDILDFSKDIHMHELKKFF